MNRLLKSRCYLAGAMDRVADRGKAWRDDITPFLESLGVTVFNPLKKPEGLLSEDDSTHLFKKQLNENEKYDELSKLMREIRSVDLRLVDVSDFLIVHINVEHHLCGTYEELATANKSKKAIIAHVQQGKKHTPDWIFGMIPHQMIFSEWFEVKDYLNYINSSNEINDYNRWRLFSC